LRKQRSKKTLFLNLYDYPFFRWVIEKKNICETKKTLISLRKVEVKVTKWLLFIQEIKVC
jgi:hypothetical protein